jgi:hypothetical protein
MARRELALAAAVFAAACGSDNKTVVGPGTPQLEAVNGAAFPIAELGEHVTLEGIGFGPQQGSGTVRFRSASSTIAAPPESTTWSDTHIETVVPEGVSSGAVEVVTDDGDALELPILIASLPTFDPATLEWSATEPLPAAVPGIAAAAGQQLSGDLLTAFVVVLVGGSTPGDSTRAYLSAVDATGAVQGWQVASTLPSPRTHATLIFATAHTTRRSTSPALYVVGGLSPEGQPLGTVIAASLTLPDGVIGEWVPVAALPEGLVAPRATLSNGTIYLTGGTDAADAPRQVAYTARIRADGALEGWFRGPDPQGALAYHGSAHEARTLWVFGGAAGTAPPVDPDTLEPRRDDAARTTLSSRSGYFESDVWIDGGAAMQGGRSRFATLRTGDFVLAVGGLYPGASQSLAETVAAGVTDVALGPFVGPVGSNTIAGLGGGIPVDAVGVSWRDLTGSTHGLLLGGFDLLTGVRSSAVWRF